MNNQQQVHEGGCACGAVRFTASGAPRRIGLCHCMTCRKAHSAAFNPFVVFGAADVVVVGELRNWASSAGYTRSFCPTCGSRVFGSDGSEVELSLGSFDSPGTSTPEYELWTGRREPWLNALDVPQFEQNRPQLEQDRS